MLKLSRRRLFSLLGLTGTTLGAAYALRFGSKPASSTKQLTAAISFRTTSDLPRGAAYPMATMVLEGQISADSTAKALTIHVMPLDPTDDDAPFPGLSRVAHVESVTVDDSLRMSGWTEDLEGQRHARASFSLELRPDANEGTIVINGLDYPLKVTSFGAEGSAAV